MIHIPPSIVYTGITSAELSNPVTVGIMVVSSVTFHQDSKLIWIYTLIFMDLYSVLTEWKCCGYSHQVA